MSVSFIVSPLCQVRYLDTHELPPSADKNSPIPIPDSIHISEMSWSEVEKHLCTHPKSEVIAWRRALSRKYLNQLGEPLNWDEDSTFSESEDVGGTLGMLSHTAATIDILGDKAAALKMINRAEVPISEEMEFSRKAEAKGFTVKFPQLLLDAGFWLPFRRNMIIEEPDLLGETARFGSLFRLGLEIDALQNFIRRTEPSATRGNDGGASSHPTVLRQAWSCAAVMSRLIGHAISHRVPMTLSD